MNAARCWLFPTTRWPAEDSWRENELRRDITDVLAAGGTTGRNRRDHWGADRCRHAQDRGVTSDLKAAKARGKEIGQGNWASDSVRKAIQESPGRGDRCGRGQHNSGVVASADGAELTVDTTG